MESQREFLWPALAVHHFSVSVPNLQACLDALVLRGVDIAAVQRHPGAPMCHEPDPRDTRGGEAFAAFIRDPGRTLIELLEAGRVGA